MTDPRCWACDGPTRRRTDYHPATYPGGQALVAVEVNACVRPGCEVTEAVAAASAALKETRQ